jgi:hypothetical protein
MTAEVLMKKTGRYLRGESVPAEKRQIQTWLSCMEEKEMLPQKEKEKIESEIVTDIHNYITYSTFNPEPKTWWNKITACF